MGWAAAAYQYGILATHWYWIGAIPAMLFLGIVMMPFYYISKTHSVPGYLKLRFGEPAAALSAVSFGFMTVLMSGINMYSMALVMKVVLGWDINFSIWVSSITVAVYVGARRPALGHLQRSAAVRPDLAGRAADPDPRPDRGGRLERHGGAHPRRTSRAATTRTCGARWGRSPTTRWASTGPASCSASGWVISFGYWTTDFLVVQRVLAAKDLRSAKMAPIIGAGFKMMVPFIVILPGLLGLALLPIEAGGRGAGGGDRRPQLQRGAAADAGALLRARACSGLGITALIAGFMSGMAGNVSAFATVWTYDIYRALHQEGRHRRALRDAWAAGARSSACWSASARPTW